MPMVRRAGSPELVNRGFEAVRRTYGRSSMLRFQNDAGRIVAAAVLVMAATWPLYSFSRRELAPVEDQSHISLFMQASPDASLTATNRASLDVINRVQTFPEAKFMWSLTTQWGGFGGMVTKDWKERARTTQQMYGEVFGTVSSVPGLRVFPRLDPPLPTPGQYDVELVLESDAPPEQMLQAVGQVVGAGWQSGKFLYVDTDLKIDLPEARVIVDREKVADLGLDLADGRPGAGHAARRRLRQPVQLLRSELQGHPADRRRRPGHDRSAARPQDQDAERRAGAGLDLHAGSRPVPRRDH